MINKKYHKYLTYYLDKIFGPSCYKCLFNENSIEIESQFEKMYPEYPEIISKINPELPLPGSRESRTNFCTKLMQILNNTAKGVDIINKVSQHTCLYISLYVLAYYLLNSKSEDITRET